MAKTLEQGFDTFLGWLAPLKSEHDLAISHKDSVYSCLSTNFNCIRLMETGSFGNGTGIRHFSDTDYFACIPNDKLSISSSYTLTKLKDALQYTFWRTQGIRVNTPAVQIPFGKYASESLEITPCAFKGVIDTNGGKHQAYHIPDGSGGWMLSSPSAHNAYVRKHDERLGRKLKPFIQLVKAWKYYNNVPISSFYLELRATKYAEGEQSIIYDIDLTRFMKYLDNCGLASIQDPMGVSGLIPACSTQSKKEDAISKLATGRTRAEKAYEKRGDDLDKCFEWWDKFFGNQFPAR